MHNTSVWHYGWICGIVLSFTLVGGVKPVGAAKAKETPQYPTMSEAEKNAFLAQPLVARLAVVRDDGTPQVTPMWFLYEDGVLYMSTHVKRAKAKHIKNNPRVAVAIDVMEAPLKNKIVIIEGPAELVTTGVKEMTTRIYKKYLGVEGTKTPRAQQNINAERILIKITPVVVQTMDTTK